MAETVRPPEFTPQIETAQILLRNGVFEIADSPIYPWSGGLMSPIYSNVRLVNGDVDGRTKVTDFLVSETQKKEKPDFIAGVVSAGLPWADNLAVRMRLPMIPVRPEPKDHGTGGQIDGRIGFGDHGIAVEDTISTGGSVFKSIRALRLAGARVNTALAILDYQLFDSAQKAKDQSVKITALTNFPTVIAVAEWEGYWDKNKVAFVRDWYKDPVAWAEKFRD